MNRRRDHTTLVHRRRRLVAIALCGALLPLLGAGAAGASDRHRGDHDRHHVTSHDRHHGKHARRYDRHHDRHHRYDRHHDRHHRYDRRHHRYDRHHDHGKRYDRRYRYDYGHRHYDKGYDHGYRYRHGHRRHFSIPRFIAHAAAHLFKDYYYERHYYADHRHYHDVYRFPVYGEHGVYYRPYAYCEGGYFAAGYFDDHGRVRFDLRVGY